jgi:predicted flavoprotein YhiN
VILNRRTLLASLGLALPALGAEAATSTTAHKKKKPLHASKPSGVKTAAAKPHHKAHPHTAGTTPTQS